MATAKVITDDPLVCRDSAGNLAPIAQFYGDLTAGQAAQHFAEHWARPEPRNVRSLEGEWTRAAYSGKFRLVGGKRTYLLTCDKLHQSWRVYMMPKGEGK